MNYCSRTGPLVYFEWQVIYACIVKEATTGERYLHVYGVMQAFVIQQDAIRNLAKALGFPDLVDLTQLAHIRDLRVASAGHPVDVSPVTTVIDMPNSKVFLPAYSVT